MVENCNEAKRNGKRYSASFAISRILAAFKPPKIQHFIWHIFCWLPFFSLCTLSLSHAGSIGNYVTSEKMMMIAFGVWWYKNRIFIRISRQIFDFRWERERARRAPVDIKSNMHFNEFNHAIARTLVRFSILQKCWQKLKSCDAFSSGLYCSHHFRNVTTTESQRTIERVAERDRDPFFVGLMLFVCFSVLWFCSYVIKSHQSANRISIETLCRWFRSHFGFMMFRFCLWLGFSAGAEKVIFIHAKTCLAGTIEPTRKKSRLLFQLRKYLLSERAREKEKIRM